MFKNIKHIKPNFHLLIIFALLIGSSVSQAQVNAKAKIDSSKILIGDHVNLDLEVSFPNGINLKWPLILDTLSKFIEVISQDEIDTSKNENQTTLKQRVKITCFDSGFFVIPPIKFLYQKKNDTNIYTSETEPLLLDVKTLEVDTAKAIMPIKEPISVPITLKEILTYSGIAVAIALLVLGIIYYLKRRKKQQPIMVLPKKPKIPAHIIALDELEKLRRKKLWQEGKIKEYHSELTEIVRHYIERRFSIHAIEMTSSEILDAFERANESAEIKEKLRTMLTQADMVKFAKAQPLPAEHDVSMNFASDFIKSTIIAVNENKSIENGNKNSSNV